MSEHPIEALMKTAMESIKEMVNVSTVVGEAVETPDGSVIIPISRVACGFAAGGSEFCIDNFRKGGNSSDSENPMLPFGGGSGAGVSVQPVGFLVVGNGQVRMMSVCCKNAFVERLIDTAPQVMEKLQNLVSCKAKKTENTVTINTDAGGTTEKKDNPL